MHTHELNDIKNTRRSFDYFGVLLYISACLDVLLYNCVLFLMYATLLSSSSDHHHSYSYRVSPLKRWNTKKNKEGKNAESDHTTPYHYSGRANNKDQPGSLCLYSSPRPTPYSHLAPALTHSSHGRPLLHDYALVSCHSFLAIGEWGMRHLQTSVYVCSEDSAGRRCGCARRGSCC